MANLDLLKNSLINTSPVFGAELDAVFNDITSLIEAENFELAHPLIEEVLHKGRFDIRLIMYLLYIHMQHVGICSFAAIFDLLAASMTVHWQNLSPSEKLEQHFQKSLHWFLNRALKNLEYIDKQRKKGDTVMWQKYMQGADSDAVKLSQDCIQQLNTLICDRWNASPLSEKMHRLNKWIQDLFQAYWIEECKKKQTEETPPIQEEKELLAPKLPSLDDDWITLLSSEPFKLLMHKLQAFKQLLKQEDYKKASLVADDIAQNIAQFNPLSYFPKLFVEHFSLSATYFDELNRDSDWKETHFYTLLNHLYQSDLESFMHWKS